ncbi:hypothetical protein [Paenibacillus macerans]|uniref:DUF4352 domain-containing protein n=2 Tax=Paenibacillus macerans TaxID=44252 RepID=A0A090Y4B2_PAEMA|nr:hypothetical protein [Paenibacillus macerans]KFM93041.1 hypothetical protein DJ90_2890 [Paenibacillus macerans]GBK60545.1 hypothetical protein PbDSM24746_05490 [Paenibacillus macerans]
MMKNNNKRIYLVPALFVLLLILVSACGNQPGAGSNPNTANEKPAVSESGTQAGNAAPQAENAAGPEEKILIVIDQTAKPIEGNSFDFTVKQAPEGYALKEMKWVSDQNEIANTLEEAIEHGQTGEDGFYISGNGQFSGFFYPDSMKGEKGWVIFIFANDENNELTWEKEITLK